MPSSHDLISRRQFFQAGAGAAALASGALRLSGVEESAPRRPNILYVFSDMQRATSIGCYGDPNVHTPALDAFSRQGARLDAAMSNTPVCCPHRACLQTGLYSHRHGVVSNQVQFTRHARGIAEQARDAGYVTGYSGKWHIPQGYGSESTMPLGFPPEQSRDRHKVVAGHPHYTRVTVRDKTGREIEKEVYKPTVLTDDAIQFIQDKSKGKAPWIFFLSYLPPHSPYKAPPDYRKHYEGNLRLRPNVPSGLPTDYARSVLPDYYGMVESLDAEFQRLLVELEGAGVAKDTIVCYSSDHGDMLGCHGYEAKRWPHEESARVPFLIRYPRAIRPGTVLTDPFSTVDVYPTLAGLSGLKAPTGIDGVDYSPLFTGKSSRPPRDHVLLEMLYAYVPWPGWRALRTPEYSYARTVKGPWLLHNIVKDPYQMKNLVDDPSSRALVAEMDKRLATIMKETGGTWEQTATTGDIDLWLPGASKEQSQGLGVPWPGSEAVKSGGGPRKGGRRRRKQAAAATGGQ